MNNKDQQVKSVCKAAFPGYNGRKIQIKYNVKSKSLRSYWDGGSKSSYAVIDLNLLKVLHAPDSHPFFDRLTGVDSFDIPEGYAVVEHSIFCGRDMGLTIHIPDAAPLLLEGHQGVGND